MKAILLCGGGGTRLWPLSRKNKPKQFHRLVRNNSLIQEAVLRVKDVIPMEDVYISTNKDFVDEINFQFLNIPEENIITEPCKMDNAPAIGLTLGKIMKDLKGKSESIVILYSDHIYQNTEKFAEILKKGEEFCKKHKDTFLSVGVRPTYPSTGYGYIKMTDEKIEEGVYKVEHFYEKPSLEKAKEYCSSWEYLWNLGLFMADAEHFYKLFEKHLPKTHQGVEKILSAKTTEEYTTNLGKIYKTLDKTSIDKGIVEKLNKVAVIPADNMGWTDVGNWKELRDIQVHKRDKNNNVTLGKVATIDTNNCLIYSKGKRLVTTIGLDDMIVVETEDAVLVMPAEKYGSVKDLVELMKEKGMDLYL